MNASLRSLVIGLGIAGILAAGIYTYVTKYSSNPQSSVGGEVQAPSLDRPYTITATLPEEAKVILRADMEKIIPDLRKNPGDFDNWLELAIHYKIAGDYDGAAAVWRYVAYAAPNLQRYVALGNLGDLYMNFIKDYPKAEDYYRQGLAINPQAISFYRDLYTLYRYLYKTDTPAASDILAEGLAKNPGNADLLKIQADFKAGR